MWDVSRCCDLFVLFRDLKLLSGFSAGHVSEGLPRILPCGPLICSSLLQSKVAIENHHATCSSTWEYYLNMGEIDCHV